ncbi:apolipoprotein N-acyltransferase [Marispirochaeta sp.]|uniref:apolipoprotein N-acyltransferase n=1 Tax=Marispirochaeta sp. TaxID=2038653 RepID=UPI0029C8AA7C|nr:apolipoprotein N-acyltransferase [Marispirochaeta sp.]
MIIHSTGKGFKPAIALILILFALAQIILAFYGPVSLTRTPSLMVAPFSHAGAGLNTDEAEELTRGIEAAYASAGSSSVKPQRLVEEYLMPTDRSLSDISDRASALELARELGVLRLVQPVLSSWDGELSLYLWLYDTVEGRQIASQSFKASSLDGLIRSLTGPEFAEAFDIPVAGLTPFDYSFFLFLGLEILLAFLLLRPKPCGLFNQSLIILGVTLYLFAFFFARNANMDYVQRFVAHGGELKMAGDTARQQLEAALRFLPLLVLNLGLYLFPGGSRHQLFAGKKLVPGRAIRSNPPAGGISASIPAAVEGVVRHTPGLLAAWLSGLLYTLALPSLFKLQGIPVLSFVALIPLFLFCRRASRGEAAAAVMAFASLQVMLINFWHSTYSYVSLPFTVLLSLAQWFIFLPVLVWILRRPGRSWIFLVPSAWVVFDWLRGMGFLAYPWGMLGTSLYSWTVFIQAASLTGVWGISWLVIAFNAVIAELLSAREHRRSLLAGAAALLLIPLSFGVLTLVFAPEPEESITVLLVQHNRDPRKHDYAESLDALLALSEDGLVQASEEGKTVDLVAWPETAFVPDIRFWMRPGNQGRPRRKLAERMLSAVDSWDTWLVTGSSDHTRLPKEGDTDYPEISHNSTYLITPDGEIESIYHKIKLVPFTEYFPFKEELPAVYEQLDKFDVTDWTPGSESLLHRQPKAPFTTPICFEDIMPGHVRRFVAEGTRLIVNVSNDYWSLSPVEGMQHGVNGLFRAVENRVPLVRSTTSGLTLAADPWGRVLETLTFYEEGFLLAELPTAPPGKTMYTRFGDWFPLLLSIIILVSSVKRLSIRSLFVTLKRHDV